MAGVTQIAVVSGLASGSTSFLFQRIHAPAPLLSVGLANIQQAGICFEQLHGALAEQMPHQTAPVNSPRAG